jgi:anti-sigma regulatory factor (Ser/Thr protein kinase)
VPATIASVARVQHALRDVLGAHVAPATLVAAEIVVEETLMNAARHAFDEADGQRVEVDVRLEADRVTLVFRDRGRPFDPTAAELPPLPDSLEAASVGGLGLRLLRGAATRLAYARRDGVNELTVEIATRPG